MVVLPDAPVISHATGHYVAGAVRGTPQTIPSQSLPLTPTQRESFHKAPSFWSQDAQPRSPFDRPFVPHVPETLGGNSDGSGTAAPELKKGKSTLCLDGGKSEKAEKGPAAGPGPEHKDALYFRTKWV